MTALLMALLLCVTFPAASQAPEPEEPDIVLPEVILTIEDFSMESVESGLMAEESLPPSRELPLPAREETAIAEPVLPIGVEAPPAPAAAAISGAEALSALLELGAGNMNHVYSQVSLFRLGTEPRFKLRFLHEALDGMAGEDAGAGFNRRTDTLEGELRFRLGELELDTEGGLLEEERGLQGRSLSFVSRIFQRGAAGADLSWPLGERFALGGSIDGSFASQLLTGSPPEAITEILFSPLLSARLSYPKFWLELVGRYSYRGYLEQAMDPSHRAGADLRLGVEALKNVHLEASGGWYWGSLMEGNLAGHLFPFSFTLSLTPAPSFALRLRGGFEIEEVNAQDILEACPWIELPGLVVPGVILDDPVWFADAALDFTLKRALSLHAGVRFARHAALPQPSLTLDTATGLFPLDQGWLSGPPRVELPLAASLRWTIAPQASLSAGWSMELLEPGPFEPKTELRLEGQGASASGRWGAQGSLAYRIGYDLPPPRYNLMPELDLSAFFRPVKAISLIAEGQDLLSPLSADPRWSWDPFEEPGIRVTLKMQINL